MRTLAFRCQTRSPSDVAELESLFARGALDPRDVVAVLGKTEGNGGRNDFTRELATRAVLGLLSARTGVPEAELAQRVVLSFSGGCEGVMSPHLVVFAVAEKDKVAPRALPHKRLAIAVGSTRDFSPEEIGRKAQIAETARVVRELAGSLRLESGKDVHLVQVKGAIPSATFEAQEAARKAGRPLRNDMVFSRGASALGVALGVGELSEAELGPDPDEAVCSNWNLYSGVASVSAKPGLARSEIMLLANSPYWEGECAIAHGVMKDILDASAARSALSELGITFGERPSPEQLERVVAVFAKSEADPRGLVRGKRHVMLEDDDVSDTRYSRCTVAAVLASTIGDGAVYVSTRAEHHGPLGGGPVAIIARTG